MVQAAKTGSNLDGIAACDDATYARPSDDELRTRMQRSIAGHALAKGTRYRPSSSALKGCAKALSARRSHLKIVDGVQRVQARLRPD